MEERRKWKDPNIEKLLTHKINSTVKFTGEMIIYEKDGKIACNKGLTTLLSTFFEGYKHPTKRDIQHYHSLKGETIIPKKNRVKVGDSWDKSDHMTKDENKTGRALGKLVHSQLCLYARCRTPKEFCVVCPNPHRYTVRVVNSLIKKGITLLFAEFIIVDPMVEYATPLDLVGVNSSGRLTIIEVKTGYENIFGIGRTKLQKPFEKWDNSPVNQARLQLLLPCLTLKYQYGVNVDSAWVLNVNSRDINYYPLYKSMTSNSKLLYEYLIDSYGVRSNKKVTLTKTVKKEEKKILYNRKTKVRQKAKLRRKRVRRKRTTVVRKKKAKRRKKNK